MKSLELLSQLHSQQQMAADYEARLAAIPGEIESAGINLAKVEALLEEQHKKAGMLAHILKIIPTTEKALAEAQAKERAARLVQAVEARVKYAQKIQPQLDKLLEALAGLIPLDSDIRVNGGVPPSDVAAFALQSLRAAVENAKVHQGIKNLVEGGKNVPRT